jgi:CHAD domain-containing protein
MELELDADPEIVAKLAGLKLLTTTRDGRPRSQSVKVVWHDSPDHALLDRGLTLAERRADWRLEQVVPSAETWLPGQPSPVLEQAEQQASLTDLPTPLAPVAAFEGRRTISVHLFQKIPVAPGAVAPTHAMATSAVLVPGTLSPTAHAPAPSATLTTAPATLAPGTTALAKVAAALAPVTISVERGVLRSVTAERAVARITLSGGDHAVRSAALMIAAAVPVSVPRASLAAQAIALATGGVPAPRHRGAPVLPDADMAVTAALAHILGHLTDVILYYAPVAVLPARKPPAVKALPGEAVPDTASAGHGSTTDILDAGQLEAVHQMRVAVRRALSAVSIFRDVLSDGTLDAVQSGLKALGSRLGHTRDWDVFVSETAPMIMQALPPDQRMDRLIAAALRRRRECRKELTDYLTSSAFRILGIELSWFAAAGFWRSDSAWPADDQSQDTPDHSSDGPDRLAGEAPDEKSAEPLSVRAFAPRVLQQRWKKLLSAGKRIQELDVPSLHGVRLRAKRARYAAEMFAVSHEGKAAQRFITRLSLLQQRLGVLNDGAVAADLLEQLGGPSGRHAYAIGVVVGFTASRTGRIRPRIIRAFEKFRRQPPYWT